MAERSRQLLGVPGEIEKRVHHVDVAAGGRERVGLGLVHQKELERVRVAGLGHLGDRSAIGFKLS